MRLQKKFTKKIALLLIVSILSLNLSFLTLPKKANAFLGFGDTAVVWDPALTTMTNIKILLDKGEQLLEKLLAALVKTAALKLINMVMQSTADWIKGGFNGTPAYISDVNKFLGGTGGVADQTVGQWFQNQGNLSFLCNPFKIQVSLALEGSYGAGQKMNCTLSQVINNSVAAATSASVTLDINGNPITINSGSFSANSDFKNSGGWDTWLKSTLQPQNNPVGAYWIAKANLDAAITDAQGNKVADLNFGSGALSFKKCVDTYYAVGGGEITHTDSYVQSVGYQPSVPTLATQYAKNHTEGYRVDTKCDVATPGSAITAWATQKATADVRQSEYVTAFANGLDQIFSALVGVIMQKALAQLRGGVLNTDAASNNAYMSTIDSLQADALNTYSTGISDLNNEQGSIDLNNPNSFPTSTDVFATIPPIIIGNPGSTTTTTEWNYSTIGSENGNIYTGNTALDMAKSNANTLLNSLTASESAYQNNYLIAQNLLTQAKNVFATSSACNMNYNRSDTILRSLLIRSNVVTNIEGVVNDPNRSIASIPWNLQTIKDALKVSATHMTILNTAASAISYAGSIQNVSDAMIPVNSTSFNTDPQATMVANIKTWLRGVQGMYDTARCPINLTQVLKINTPATSTTQ